MYFGPRPRLRQFAKVWVARPRYKAASEPESLPGRTDLTRDSAFAELLDLAVVTAVRAMVNRASRVAALSITASIHR